MAATAKFPQDFAGRLWMQSRGEDGAKFSPHALKF